jgi:DNA-binding MarR family transcriptional regulator
MNEIAPKINQALLTYQTFRLRNLILEMVQCCEDRKLYESHTFGLPYSELKCLMLFDGERYLTVKGIARRLDVAKSRVTKIVNGLIEKGLVKQIDDPGDARIRRPRRKKRCALPSRSAQVRHGGCQRNNWCKILNKRLQERFGKKARSLRGVSWKFRAL